MTNTSEFAPALLDPAKFRNPRVTAKGEPRASVALTALKTLWFNTGTLCNLTCAHCYIESSPTNDRLAYLTAAEVESYLDQLEDLAAGPLASETLASETLASETLEIGFTGGEPFMNPEIIAMLDLALGQGHGVLVLTNASKPMLKLKPQLLDLKQRYGDRLVLRVSLDHYTALLHEMERGEHTWTKALPGVRWLSQQGFRLHVAGRTCWAESESDLRQGFARLFGHENIDLDDDPAALVLFPEMDESVDVPEITTACWGILDVDPGAMMCASSRMVVKHRGAGWPTVVACTLLPYDDAFEFGPELGEALQPVRLNHPHCAKFCVLGGGSCEGGD